MADEEQRDELLNTGTAHTLFISNMPYHIHASTIKDMLDTDKLAHVRSQSDDLTCSWLGAECTNGDAKQATQLWCLNAMPPMPRRTSKSKNAYDGLESRPHAGSRRGAQEGPPEPGGARRPRNSYL